MQREQWFGRFGAILAVAGSAVGLGNYLRFPGQAALYGGGAFMIPYLVAFVLLGLPIAWAEWTLGRYAGVRGYNSAPGIFRCVTGKRSMAYAGSLCVSLTTIITAFYLFIESWCLSYTLRYLFNMMPSENFSALFVDSVGLKGNGAFLGQHLLNLNVFCLVACFVVNYLLIYRGIVRGIEWFCSLALPALLVCSFMVMFRVMTLGNPTGIEGQDFISGLGFIWNPSQQGKTFFESLSNPETWIAGAGQVFFSLSLGFGVICTYASFTKKDDDICLASLTAAAANGFCEAVLAAMMVVPAAFMFLGSAFLTPENIGSSFTLGFQVLPEVFAKMPAGNLFGFLFFFLLFLAAVTSSISTIQPGIVLLEEGLAVGRKASVAIMIVITSSGAFLTAYFTDKLTALDTMDFWVCNVLIFMIAGVQIVIFGWSLGLKTAMEELNRGAQIRLPRWFGFIFKYVSPLYLLVIFAAWCGSSFSERLAKIAADPVVQVSLGYMLLVTVFNFLITARAVKRWQQEDITDNDYVI
jgi:SNF family Na+-dependent transporter